ncbi:MAG: tetratricopeptide repeat protein [Gemmatimonadetes bacterium]|nr:tetratricopeptide repeat protein [Gemmatimonadota bacterium]
MLGLPARDYLKIVDELEGTPEMDHELAVFNKVGDLYLKTNEVNSAVEMYERAAQRYVESGLPNNAIALCNKILRNAPGRTTTYLMLGDLMLQRGFSAEAKQHLLEYAQRMKKVGQVREAFKALKKFADASPQNNEVRAMLAEQLEAAIRESPDDAVLKKLYEGFTGRASSVGKAVADTADRKSNRSDLVFIDLDEDPGSGSGESAVEAGSLEIESTAIADEEPEPIERSSGTADDAEVEVVTGIAELNPLSDLETTDVEPLVTDIVELDEVPVLEGIGADDDSVEVLDDLGSLVEDRPSTGGERTSEPLAAEEVVFVTEDTTDAKGSAELPGRDVPELDLAGFDEPDAILTDNDAATVDVGGDPLAPPDGKAADENLEEYLRGTGGEVLADLSDVPDLIVEKYDAFPSLDEGTEIPELPAEPERDLGVLEAAVAQNPDDAAARRDLAEVLLEQGERDRGLDELDVALEAYEKAGDWEEATSVATEILRLEPNSVPHLQKQVEFAYRRGDEAQLVPAYLGLANALFSSGAMIESRAVYERVIELDPGNQAAKEGIATVDQMAPVEDGGDRPGKSGDEVAVTTAEAASDTEVEQPAARPVATPVAPRASGFVDLGDFILGDENQKSTRMVGKDEQSGDEQRDFRVMLSQFKKGIEENIDEADAQAHYDLGVAFKEMGLLEEAISEFQKALRAEDTRLRAAESLGMCFYEKGQLQVAATVMRRAVDVDKSGDEPKIGLLYWLGRCEEEQSKAADALVYYRRVIAVEINFQDVGDRVNALSKVGR